jgi:hypothetical protein
VVSIAKSGDLADTNNYRGISLMATLLKILCVMMGTRLNLVAEAHNLFSRAQAGFRSMEECVTQAAMVLDICQCRRLLDLPTFLVFVDLKKAYDTVPHQALFAKLSRAGIRGIFLNFLMALYAASTIWVRVGGGSQALYSEAVRLRRGVRQGCPLSSILFNLFIDDLTDSTEATGVPVPCGKPTSNGSVFELVATVRCALFADNAIGICPSLDAAVTFCDHVMAWTAENEMAVGHKKCGLLQILPTGYQPRDYDFDSIETYERLDTLAISGEPIPIVENYTYLGMLFGNNLSIALMVEHRVVGGRATVARLVPFLKCPILPMSMRLQVVTTVVIPRLLFGAEVYGMNRQLTNKMQAILNRSLQAVAGLSTCTPSPSAPLWLKMGVSPICAIAAGCRARAFRKCFFLKTWACQLVLKPLMTRKWTWSSGIPRWINRFAIWHSTEEQRLGILRHGWRNLSPTLLKQTIQECITLRERGIWLKLTQQSSTATQWYLEAEFGAQPLTKARVGGGPLDQAGLAMIVQCRIGLFVTGNVLVRCKRIPECFEDCCPFCDFDGKETLEHIVFQCPFWAQGNATNGNAANGEATSLAGSDSNNGSMGSGASTDSTSPLVNSCGSLAAARFLTVVARLRAATIRSRWGHFQLETNSSGVPTSTTGQRPNG